MQAWEHNSSWTPFLCRALEVTGKTQRCLNLGSYNYLGFAAADEYCTPRVQDVLKQYGGSMCSSRLAAGMPAAFATYFCITSDLYHMAAMLIAHKQNSWIAHLYALWLGVIGKTEKHVELDHLVAQFVGCEDAITFGMGFATNSVVIPALVGKGCLVLSDSLNHASIVSGVRGSGAKVKVDDTATNKHPSLAVCHLLC